MRINRQQTGSDRLARWGIGAVWEREIVVSQLRARLLRGRMPFYGWIVVACVTLSTFCAGPGQPFVFSVFIDPIVGDTSLTRTEVSGLYAIGTIISAATMILIGRLVDRLGGRVILITIGGAMGAACLLMASAGSTLTFLLGFSSLRILGQGFNITATLITAQWFLRHRGRAMMLVGLGFAASTGFLPVTARALIDSFGWRGAYVALGVMIWVLVIPTTVGLVQDRPEAIGLFPDGAREAPAGEHRPRSGSGAVGRQRVLTSPAFWLLAVPIGGIGFTAVALIFHQTSLFAERGLSPGVAAAAFVPFAVASAIGTFLTGILIDRFGPKRILIANLALLLAPPLMLLFIESTIAAVIYSVVLGAALGMEQVVSRATWAHFYGRHGLGRVQGPAMMLTVIMVAISPLILSELQHLTGSYRLGLALLACVPVISIVAVAFNDPARLAS
jgi:MFS family permease